METSASRSKKRRGHTRARTKTAKTAVERTHLPDLVIVQDDRLFLEFLDYLFSSRGYRVEAFSDGGDARDWLDAADPAQSAPVVLLDPEIPGLSALDLIEHCGLHGSQAFRFVILSVEGSEEAQVRGIRLGALDYLVKPVRLPVLRAKIENLLGPPPAWP